MSTSLEDLQNDSPSAIPPADAERVRRILSEMTSESVIQSPPALVPTQRAITEPPVTMSTGQLRMDSGTARAHVIGNSAPTMADFHSMFQPASPGMAPYHGSAAIPAAPQPPPAKVVSWKDMVVSQLRSPVAVAILVFLLNMPIVTSILSRYASWMYLSSGEISVGGLLVKALLAGALFLAYQTATALF